MSADAFRQLALRRLLQFGMAAFAVGAIVVFWTAEALACSYMPPPPECQTELERQQLPQCLEVERGETGTEQSSCVPSATVTNGCETAAELAFFCSSDSSETDDGDSGGAPRRSTDCPDDRIVYPEESESFDITSIPNRDASREIGVRVEMLEGDSGGDGSGQNTDEGTGEDNETDGDTDTGEQLQSGLTFRIEAEKTEMESDPCSMGTGPLPMGCSASSSTKPPLSFLMALLVLAGAGMLRRKSPRDPA